MMIRVVLCCVLLAGSALRAGAQSQPSKPEGLTTVRVAKWVFLAAAVGLGAYALSNTAAATQAYDDLRDLCSATPERCTLSGGRYSDAEAEALYQRTADADRRARVGIVGGQLTLLGSVALFVYDLRGRDSDPENLPYPVPAGGGGAAAPRAALGVRLAF